MGLRNFPLVLTDAVDSVYGYLLCRSKSSVMRTLVSVLQRILLYPPVILVCVVGSSFGLVKSRDSGHPCQLGGGGFRGARGDSLD